MKKIITIGSFLIAIAVFTGCFYDKEELVYPNTPGTGNNCDTSTITYTNHIQQIINTRCQGCHTGPSPSSGYNLSTYQLLRSKALDNNKLMNRLTSTTNPMPPTGPLPDCEINKIRAWINKGFPN